ncbi:FAD/NAD(P)-binding protein [Kitasatospora sp. NPDC093558]|uniref:FAD/NAD(P)-binding protein n=1 Tax=Kitasatospora sp. NPDC093558 TaxID=3155201 RepID=UPI00343DB36F
MIVSQQSAAIVGMGPRGLSVLERLCANARTADPANSLHIHVVDPYAPGAGRVWRSSQSRHLLMNTVASQISVFTDATVDLDGPLEPGPSLHLWAQELVRGAIRGDYSDETLAEARDLGPDSYPTRAFYGHYLSWAYRYVVAGAPAHVTVVEHRSLAVALEDEPGSGEPGESPSQTLLLADGTRLSGLGAVVLVQGHLPARPTPSEHDLATAAAAHGLTLIAPANPADVDLGAIPAGANVILRGLGLNFFDYMTLLTTGRGGAFTRADGRLVYEPSGREPVLYAGSRRGVPYQARGENEKGPHGRHQPLLLTPGRIAELTVGRADPLAPGVDFRTELWPLIAKEVETVYYRTLLESRGEADGAQRFQDAYLPLPWGDPAEAGVREAFGIGSAQLWDWDQLSRPYRDQEFGRPEDFRDWLLDHLREDLVQARTGNVSGPLKAALDVLRDLRNEIRLVVDHGGLDGDSYRTDLDRWYTPLNAFLSIGPPARRIEEMIALVEAGVLHLTGPAVQVALDPDAGTFMARSPHVPGSVVTADVLIEARLPEITLRRTGDALLRGLLDSGQAAPYRIRSSTGWHVTDGLAVTGRPFHLVDAAGRAHGRRFAFGVPTESVHWVTAAGIRPGVNSVTLTDSDAIARAALRCVSLGAGFVGASR